MPFVLLRPRGSISWYWFHDRLVFAAWDSLHTPRQDPCISSDPMIRIDAGPPGCLHVFSVQLLRPVSRAHFHFHDRMVSRNGLSLDAKLVCVELLEMAYSWDVWQGFEFHCFLAVTFFSHPCYFKPNLPQWSFKTNFTGGCPSGPLQCACFTLWRGTNACPLLGSVFRMLFFFFQTA